ncbi:MAG: bifunctional riboflavin kinase/FAD synthetase [Ruminococcaceae bacterium]|nr:bifunctional riboflavin kinase/FAD synthetase [Oscillospiraceae bacterium]
MEEKRVVALGFFDGVHLGHAELLKKSKEIGKSINAVPTVLSFDVHPDNLVYNTEVPLINAPKGRAELISRLFGINSVIFMHFNKTVMQMPWQDFIVSLVRELNISHFVVGYDFKFGNKGEGNPQKLAQHCKEHGLGCDIIDKVELGGVTVSSTCIRQLLEEGDMETANKMLGHPHCLLETVGYGFGLGKTIGTPTINMSFPEGVLIPKHGVYITRAITEDGRDYPAITNIGIRPTVSSENKVSVESYLIGFEGNLYESTVRVDFYKYLRGERKFSSVEELRAQILKDAEESALYFQTFNSTDE